MRKQQNLDDQARFNARATLTNPTLQSALRRRVCRDVRGLSFPRGAIMAIAWVLAWLPVTELTSAEFGWERC